jgi:hypothetical protein
LQTESVELNATPATPVALFAFAAIVPATCVPCMLSSAQVPFITVPPNAAPQSTVLPLRSV